MIFVLVARDSNSCLLLRPQRATSVIIRFLLSLVEFVPVHGMCKHTIWRGSQRPDMRQSHTSYDYKPAVFFVKFAHCFCLEATHYGAKFMSVPLIVVDYVYWAANEQRGQNVSLNCPFLPLFGPDKSHPFAIYWQICFGVFSIYSGLLVSLRRNCDQTQQTTTNKGGANKAETIIRSVNRFDYNS